MKVPAVQIALVIQPVQMTLLIIFLVIQDAAQVACLEIQIPEFPLYFPSSDIDPLDSILLHPTI